MSRRRWPSAVVLAVILGGVLAGLMRPAPAAAHDATTAAHAEVTGTGANVKVVLDLEYDLLMKSAWLYAEAYEAKERTEQLRQLAINRDAVTAYVTDRFAVAYDDRPCAPTPAGEADVRVRGKAAFAVLTYAYACAGGEGGVHAISSALFPDTESFVHSTETLVRYDLDGEKGSAVLVARNPTLRVGEHPASHQIGEFFLLGAEHLLLGLDHIFFLLALLLGARRLRDIVVTASAFTAAHSITFLLAAMGIVDVPGEIVEPVIAASIIVVAVTNLLGRGEDSLGRWRLPIVFAFGLVHGLGFAGALDIKESGSWELLLSLLSFNLGIEATQLAIIAVLFPLLLLLRRTSATRWAMAAISVPIVAVSLYWFLDRIPLPL
ncbi:HupE/UreJ family protein [Streptosporangium lutulentum]|uniref:Hydrogenase/urease accessory protein HupE n=1 Tax=Streptosporangium lutulentum TaxID=1461250 RepID=A0ABT9Q8P2_9ACTN|nr:HupE/UreJ family protein [Streptosporangium lutulentum]MDP9842766.1 hydrogenase/urease accessory protein HupE [Streptosporangium lutulentum]